MKTGRRQWLGLAAVCFLFSGCASKSDGPPAIRYGQDICAECRMIISDAKFSGAMADEKNQIYKFDDLGCMKRFEKEKRLGAGRIWAHDYTTGEWIDARGAFFVLAKEHLVTPMGYGAAAFATQQAAENFLPGQLMVSWDGLSVLNQKEEVK